MATSRGRVSKRIAAEQIAARVSPIFVCAEKGGNLGEVSREGHRVLRVVVYDVTPRGKQREIRKGRQVFEALRIACEGETLGRVRAELMEMGARLDGCVCVL